MADKTADIVGMIVAGIVAGTFLLSPAACTMHRHYRIEQAIKHGADPIAARCGIESEIGYDRVCVALAASRNNDRRDNP